MKAEIVSIGTELLLGHTVNTNAAYLARKLASLGIDLFYQTTVGDNPQRIVSVLQRALQRSDIVITTGGLGPTVDDITLSAIASAFSKKLVYNKQLEKCIHGYIKSRRYKITPHQTEKQAYLPAGARWFRNDAGTAPGIVMIEKGTVIIALPGPPRELIPIVDDHIAAYLKKNGFAGNTTIISKTLKLTGLPEAAVNKKVKDLLGIGPKTTLGIYVHFGQVDLRITSKAKNKKAAFVNIGKIERIIQKRLGKFIYGSDNDTLESSVGYLLKKKRKSLALAESCTGGLISSRITDVAGSSDYFKMGIVAYSNEAKIKLLDLTKGIIDKYGAVSLQVAEEMAKGVKRLAHSDVALGVTGIAGPQGGTKKKPVGLVCIALVSGKKRRSKAFYFEGNRKEVKQQTSIAALNMIRTFI